MSIKLEDSKPKIQIKESDVFTYYLQRNFWAQGFSYEQILFALTENGDVEIIETEEFERRQNNDY